jgi:hypothetical protein
MVLVHQPSVPHGAREPARLGADADDAKASFRASWEAYKAVLPPGELEAVWASDPANKHND